MSNSTKFECQLIFLSKEVNYGLANFKSSEELKLESNFIIFPMNMICMNYDHILRAKFNICVCMYILYLKIIKLL
jgi:hypothetical protein